MKSSYMCSLGILSFVMFTGTYVAGWLYILPSLSGEKIKMIQYELREESCFKLTMQNFEILALLQGGSIYEDSLVNKNQNDPTP